MRGACSLFPPGAQISAEAGLSWVSPGWGMLNPDWDLQNAWGQGHWGWSQELWGQDSAHRTSETQLWVGSTWRKWVWCHAQLLGLFSDALVPISAFPGDCRIQQLPHPNQSFFLPTSTHNFHSLMLPDELNGSDLNLVHRVGTATSFLIALVRLSFIFAFILHGKMAWGWHMALPPHSLRCQHQW